MSILYDIVISVAIGGILLAMLVGFNGNIAEQATAQTVKLLAQTNLTTLTNVVEYEFRKMGYLVPKNTDSAIVYADSNKITFKGDFDNNGTVDMLTYSLNLTGSSGNANTKTRILYRTPNNQPASAINVGITRFRIWYYDRNGNPLTANPLPRPSQVKYMRVGINLESTVPYKATREIYVTLNPGGCWEKIIRPKNL